MQDDIVARVLRREHDPGKYIVVAPATSLNGIEAAAEAEVERTKAYLNKEFELDGCGWEAWEREHPRALSLTTVSWSLYDPASDIFLVYEEKLFGMFGATESSGSVFALRAQGDGLGTLQAVMLGLT